MGWNEIGEKHKKLYDKIYVGYEETYERTFIKTIVKEEFPSLSDSAIEAAMISCYTTVPAPCSRGRFFSYMRQKLKVG